MNPDYLGYLQLLNVLLIPLVLQAVKLSARLQKIESSIEAHVDLDDVEHGTLRRDLERVEGNASAAHRRLDNHGIKPASASP